MQEFMLFRKYSGIVFACGIQTYTSSIYPISGALSHIKAAKAVGKTKERGRSTDMTIFDPCGTAFLAICKMWVK